MPGTIAMPSLTVTSPVFTGAPMPGPFAPELSLKQLVRTTSMK